MDVVTKRVLLCPCHASFLFRFQTSDLNNNKGGEVLMARLLYHDLHTVSRKAYPWLLALCWSSGMILGCVISASAEPVTFSLMRSTVSGPVSIVGLLGVTLFPLLCSAFAVYISRPCLLMAAAFCKAFLFGFIALAMRTAFGDAGWVYQQLLMFSDICSLPVMYLFALRHPPERFRLHVGDGIFLLWGIAVAVIDYSLVSPYLAEL